jgi:NAD(P)H dehydrogenase (quinone)
MDQAGIAAAVSEVRGRPVTYEPMSIEAYRQLLEALGVMPAFLVQRLCAVSRDCQDGIFAGSNDIIGPPMTGKPPMTVQEFVASHIDLC